MIVRFLLVVLWMHGGSCLGPNMGLYEDPNYKLLPPIYRMDDFQGCKNEGGQYCEVHLEMEPIGASPVWDIVEETTASPRVYFPRSRLRRALCLPKSVSKDDDGFLKAVLDKMDYELKPINLTAHIIKADCDRDIKIGLFDVIFVIVAVSYFSVILYSTYVDFQSRKAGKGSVEALSIPGAFSYLSNWDRFKKLPSNPDYQRLKSFQGMRCVIMFLIVLGHSLYSHMYGYLANPEAVETHFFMYPFQMLMIMGMFQVQAYLFMSGFLLGLQVLTMSDLFKGFHLRQAFLMLINRFLRLVPVVGTMIAFHTTSIPLQLLQAPMASKLVQRTDNCKKNWWKTLLFIHNNESPYKMCESGTWYIGVDSQMYAISLVVMFFVIKYKLGWKFLVKLGVLCSAGYAFMMYYLQTDIYCRVTPEKLQFGEAEYQDEFSLLYMSTYSSASTFFIGILFGWIYYRNKDAKLDAKLWFLPWLVCFFVVPWYVLHFTIGDTTSIFKPIIGALLKPIFSAGLGLGLLGMAFGIGGPVKRFFEWKGFEYFANITFCLYIFHFDLVFPRSLTIDEPLFLNYSIIAKDFLMDFAASIFIGFTMYMTLELPCANLIKIMMKDIVEKEKKKIKKDE